MQPLRIVFCGTPDFSVPALAALRAAGHQVVAVYTQPDRPAGRGRRLTASPVKSAAQAAGIPVEQPPTLRDAAARDRLRSLAPDLMVVVAYGLILPPAVLEIPRLGCWNIHASLLPRWRGAAPIQRALLAGDTRTGVCIMQMEAGLDTGPVLACRETPITDEDNAGTLHDRLAAMGAELLTDCLQRRDELSPIAQPSDGATYAAKIDKAEAVLDWSQPAAELAHKVRAFNPWPGARAALGALELKIWQAQVTGDNGQPGSVCRADAEGIVVACGEGALRLTEIQPPGRRRMSATDFLNAHRDLVS